MSPVLIPPIPLRVPRLHSRPHPVLRGPTPRRACFVPPSPALAAPLARAPQLCHPRRAPPLALLAQLPQPHLLASAQQPDVQQQPDVLCPRCRSLAPFAHPPGSPPTRLCWRPAPPPPSQPRGPGSCARAPMLLKRGENGPRKGAPRWGRGASSGRSMRRGQRGACGRGASRPAPRAARGPCSAACWAPSR